MPDDLPALRDRALILLGYAGAFRRSELVALDVGDLRFTRNGVYVWIADGKNDPRRAGRELYAPQLPVGRADLCAFTALQRWLELVGLDGPLFRTFDIRGRLTANRLDPSDVARVIRRRAAAAGPQPLPDVNSHDVRVAYGAGGLLCSARSLEKVAERLGPWLASKKTGWAVAKNSMEYGHDMYRLAGDTTPLFMHDGFIDGSSAALLLNPSEHVGVAVLSPTESNLSKLVLGLAELLTPR